MDNLKSIRGHLIDELIPDKNHKGFYQCPLCPSGRGGAGSDGAFSIDHDGVHGKCFSCGFYGDIFDLEAAKTGKSLSEATRAVVARYEIPSSTGPEKPAAAPVSAPAVPPPAADFSAMLRLAADRLPGSPGEEYLSGRGFTPETMKRFMLGYDPDKKAITIPYNRACSYYSTRAVDPSAPVKHWKPAGVPSALYNADALRGDKPVFVVESPLCAISIMQDGGAAVALSGAANQNLLLKELAEIPAPPMLLLSLDNDQPGADAQAKLVEKLTAAGIGFLVFNAAGACKDPNELLQKDPAALQINVSAGIFSAEERADELKEEAREKEAERDKRTGPGMIDSFLQDVSTRMYEPLPTGINDIDSALDGGFIRQQLICLGAAPGAGKTALAQWIFEGMAAKGVSCVFLNLEMSRNQILARSLSRYVARRGLRISSARIMRGYSWADEQREAIIEAAEEYKQTIAPQMIYNPDNVTTNLDVIMEYLEQEALKAEASTQAAPCVVLDYLQLLTGREREDGAELIKRAVAELKGFAIRHNTVVFLIIAHNRDSNKSGNVTMESGRDTSAIEYSADTQIGLTFTRCLKGWKDDHGIRQSKGKSPDELTKEDRQWITLKILKSRFSEPGRTVDLKFDGETMTYTQVCKEFTQVDEPTPFDGDDDDPI